MSTTEIQITVIDPSAAYPVVLKQARDGAVRFPDKGSACAWLKQENSCSFLFGPKPEMKAQYKAMKRDIHNPNKESGVLMRLNRLWVNAVAWKAMELTHVSKEDRMSLSQALRTARDLVDREMALDAIITVVEARSNKLAADHAAREAESVARHQEKINLINAILGAIMDGDLRNNLLYSKLNGFKQRQVDAIIAGEGMKVQLGQLQELSELIERLAREINPSNGGGHRGKGRDPRKVAKSLHDQAIRNGMKGKQGQKPQRGSKK